MGAPKDLEPALNRTAGFIRQLDSDDGAEAPNGPFQGTFFSSSRGGIHIWKPRMLEEFEGCLADLASAGRRVRLSASTVRGYFQTALISALVEGARPLSERIRESLATLRNRLTTPPKRWRVFFPVAGMRTPAQLVRFGNVEFLSPAAAQARDRATRRRSFARVWDKLCDGIPAIARVTVVAGDQNYATDEAREQTREVLDVLNFYADIVQRRPGAAVAMGSTLPPHSSWSIASDGSSAYTSPGSFVPPFEFPALDDAKARRVGFWRFDALLRKAKRSELQESIVAAARIAGQAVVDANDARAVLGYVSALDAVLMLGDMGGARALSVRSALLAQDKVIHRRKWAERVESLYQLRNHIVHRAQLTVASADRKHARNFASECILRMLLDRPFSGFKKAEEAKEWFDAQLLRAPPRSPTLRRRKRRR